jgi:hypothetical protein
MRKLTALVDADGILYAAALKGETVCDGKQLALAPLSRVYEDAVDRLEPGQEGRSDRVLRLPERPDLVPQGTPAELQGQPQGEPPPLMLDALRAKFADDSPYRTLLIKDLEADDVCGISAGRLNHAAATRWRSSSPPTRTSPGSGAGLHSDLDGKFPVRVITESAADDWHMMQTLMGDVCDNYKGCPGWGAIKAGELIDQFNMAGLSPAERWEEIISRFEQAGLTADDCLTQARVSRILRATDWDDVAKEPRLFQFPEGTQVTKEQLSRMTIKRKQKALKGGRWGAIPPAQPHDRQRAARLRCRQPA